MVRLDVMRALGELVPAHGAGLQLECTLSATLTKPGNSAVCQRALTVANNVAVDITTCSENQSDAAVNIANRIAAKVPKA
jgi:PknH-like extracellular domain